jgi:hypothetical protein
MFNPTMKDSNSRLAWTSLYLGGIWPRQFFDTSIRCSLFPQSLNIDLILSDYFLSFFWLRRGLW